MILIKTWIVNKSNKELTSAVIENTIEAVTLNILKTKYTSILKKILTMISSKMNSNSHKDSNTE